MLTIGPHLLYVVLNKASWEPHLCLWYHKLNVPKPGTEYTSGTSGKSTATSRDLTFVLIRLLEAKLQTV